MLKINLKLTKIDDFDVRITRKQSVLMCFDGVWLNMDRFSQIFVKNTLIFTDFRSSSFTIQSSCIFHHSSVIIHHSSLIIHHSSFIIIHHHASSPKPQAPSPYHYITISLYYYITISLYYYITILLYYYITIIL